MARLHGKHTQLKPSLGILFVIPRDGNMTKPLECLGALRARNRDNLFFDVCLQTNKHQNMKRALTRKVGCNSQVQQHVASAATPHSLCLQLAFQAPQQTGVGLSTYVHSDGDGSGSRWGNAFFNLTSLCTLAFRSHFCIRSGFRSVYRRERARKGHVGWWIDLLILAHHRLIHSGCFMLQKP